MKRNKFVNEEIYKTNKLYLLILIFFLKCAIFPVAIPQSRLNPDDSRIYFGDVTYEFINWRTDDFQNPKIFCEQILIESGYFKSISSGKEGKFHIRIVLEGYPGERSIGSKMSNRPLRTVLEFVNNAISGSTFFIIPIFRKVERQIVFIIYENGAEVKRYSYNPDFYFILGWTALLGLPWSDSKGIQNQLIRVVYNFIQDASRDKAMRNE